MSICPRMSRMVIIPCKGHYGEDIVEREFLTVECIKDECAFWTTMHTIESLPVTGCASVLGAQKNSDGRIVV